MCTGWHRPPRHAEQPFYRTHALPCTLRLQQAQLGRTVHAKTAGGIGGLISNPFSNRQQVRSWACRPNLAEATKYPRSQQRRGHKQR